MRMPSNVPASVATCPIADLAGIPAITRPGLLICTLVLLINLRLINIADPEDLRSVKLNIRLLAAERWV